MLTAGLYDQRRTSGGDPAFDTASPEDGDAVDRVTHGIVAETARRHSMLMKPSVFGRVGNAVPAMLTVTPVAVTVTMSV